MYYQYYHHSYSLRFLRQVGAEHEDGSVDEKAVRAYLSTLSDRRQSFLDIGGGSCDSQVCIVTCT